MDVLIGGVGLVLLIAAVFGLNNPKVYEDLRIPLDTLRRRLVAIVFGALCVAIGLHWIAPPAAESGVANVGAATSSPIAAATTGNSVTSASPTPVDTAPPVSRRILHWTKSADGGVIDGGVYTPGKQVWMEEFFPGAPPSEFDVVEAIDPRLPASMQAALRSLDGVSFPAKLHAGRAISADSWVLPPAVPGSAYRTFSFRDRNPDGTTTASGAIVSGIAAVQVQSGAGGCLKQTTDATGKPVFKTSTSTGEACIELTVEASTDPVVQAGLLVPWGDETTSVITSVQHAFDAVAARIAQKPSQPPFDSGQAMASFMKDNNGLLPDGPPPDWNLTVDPAPFTAAPGHRMTVKLKIRAPNPGAAMVAVGLTIPGQDATIATSQLIPIVVTGRSVTATPSPSPSLPPTPTASDTAPTVSIVQPATDNDSANSLPFSGTDKSGPYADVVLSAVANDAEDGRLAGKSIVWTTDQTKLQSGALGTGEKVDVRLYGSCGAFTNHLITVVATDAQGLTASATRQVTIGPTC